MARRRPSRPSHRARLAALVVIGAIALLGSSSAHAAGAWSAPQQLDQYEAGNSADGPLITCPSTSVCFGGSDLENSYGGTLVYHLSAAGTVTGVLASSLAIPRPTLDRSVTLTALQCPTTSLCVGLASYIDNPHKTGQGQTLDVIASTTPAAGPSSWIEQHLADPPHQLSCPTTTFCAGAGESGAVVTSQSPAGGAAAWTATTLASQIVAVDCPSAGFCLAVDTDGDVWTSTDPTGGAGAWTQSAAPTPLATIGFTDTARNLNLGARPLQNFSCAGPTRCVAIGRSGSVLVSTDPAGAAPWTSVPVSSSAIQSVYCQPGTPLCLAGDAEGDIATSTDGAAATWTSVPTSVVGPINHLACAAQRCVASSSSADSATSLFASVPAAGAAWVWTPLDAMGADALSSVSCPTAKQCTAAGSSFFYDSADPGRGVRSWRTNPVALLPDDYEPEFLGVSCYSATGCLTTSYDTQPEQRYFYIKGQLDRFNPVGGPHAFHDTGLAGGYASGIDLAFVTCAQGTCVTGFPGGWYQSADPAKNTGWRKVAQPRFDVTCLSGNTACVALAAGPFPGVAGPDLLVAQHRAGPWTSEVVDPGGQITGLACTRTKTCVIVDNGGQMFVSTTPTAGPASWQLSDTDFDGFTGVACRDAHTCVAVDGGGRVVVGHP